MNAFSLGISMGPFPAGKTLAARFIGHWALGGGYH